MFSVSVAKAGTPISITVLIALLVCLIPTTIAGLLSAIGVAGMSRLMQANVIATSGRAVEAAGDVDVLLLDKTGTITLGNRQAFAFMPAPGITEAQLADVAQLASLADETPEGRSIVILAKQRFNIREREMAAEFGLAAHQLQGGGVLAQRFHQPAVFEAKNSPVGSCVKIFALHFFKGWYTWAAGKQGLP